MCPEILSWVEGAMPGIAGVDGANGHDAVGNYRAVRLDPISTPDPGSTLLLLGIGLVGLRAWKKRLG